MGTVEQSYSSNVPGTIGQVQFMTCFCRLLLSMDCLPESVLIRVGKTYESSNTC